LKRNRLNAHEALLVLQAAINHCSLKYLVLSDNDDIGFRGLQMIGEVLPDLTLKGLNIRGCAQPLRPSGLSTLWNHDDVEGSASKHDEDSANNVIAEQMAGSALVAGMIRNTHICDLYEDHGTAWAKQIAFYLALNRSGRRKLLCGQGPASIWPLVFEKLNKKIGHIFYYFREQPGLISLSIPASKKRKMETDAM
jgi:hypothetical protein